MKKIPVNVNMPGTQKKGSSNKEILNNFLKKISKERINYRISVDYIHSSENLFLKNKDIECYVHSQYNKKREMEEMFSTVDKDVELLIIFGLGNASSLNYASRRFKNVKRVIVVEPSIQILKKVLRQKKFADRIAKIPSVTFIYNKKPEAAAQGVFDYLRENVKINYGIVYHISYRTIFENYYETLVKSIISALRSVQSNISTVEHNIYFKTQNVLNNLTKNSLDVGQVLRDMKGKPAILISAGPSLDKNIHLIEEAKKKALVIVVGSTIRIFHNKGIKPHIRSAFSPYPDENVVFDGIDDYEGIPLIYANTLDYFVVKNYDAPTARMILNGDFFSRYVYEKAGIKYTAVGGSGTIANVTFDLLSQLGCSKIILMGQDLCYTENKLYAEDSWSNPKIMLGQHGLLPEKDVYGNDVYTSKVFLGLRQDFQNMIQQHQGKGIEYINATEGGLNIQGAKNMTLQEVLDDIHEEFDFETFVSNVFSQEVSETDKESLKNEIQGLIDEVNKILEINHERKEKLQEILGDEEASIKDTLNRLKTMDSFERKLLTVDLYRNIIVKELSSHFYAIKSANSYTGDEIDKQAESFSNIFVGFTAKLFEYGHFLLENLNEVVDHI